MAHHYLSFEQQFLDMVIIGLLIRRLSQHESLIEFVMGVLIITAYAVRNDTNLFNRSIWQDS